MKNKTILVCVCGGIAAYKVCEVVSKLVQAGADVRVAMTAEAQRFVGPAAFEALTANPVYTDLWKSMESRDPQHVRLAQKEDLILVAPCTANMMAKMAAGIADELVSTLLLAADPKRVVIAPAMNQGMWNHPATQRNAQCLRDDGVVFIGPAEGWQACRTMGMGRMSEAAEIVEWIGKKLGAGKASRGVQV
jgi:phosphopantothenoylcysteine decarboxylase/phosphopantothenate--cysteine ligase